MSDLERDLAVQPLTIPVLSVAGDTYTAPGEDWDGTDTRAPLSSGEEEAGLVPATRLPAEVLNDLFGRLGEAVASVIDSPALTWRIPLRANEATDPTFAGGGNALFALCVAPADTAGNMGGEVAVCLNSDGMWVAADGHTWEQREPLGFSGPPAVEGMTAGVQNDEGRVVVFAREAGDNEFVYTPDLGFTIVSAGTAPGSVAAGNVRMCFFRDTFFLTAEAQIMYHTDVSLDTNWTDIDMTGTGWTANQPNAFVATPDEALIAIDGAPYIMRSENGTTWAAANSGLPASGITALAWSASRQRWFARNALGELWSAPLGVGAWSQEETPAIGPGSVALGLIHGIASLGRTLILAAGADLYASRDLERWMRIPVAPLQPMAVNLFWKYLLPINGRVMAWKLDDSAILMSTASSVLAPELQRIAGW